MSSGATPRRFIAGSEDAPQSISRLVCAPVRWKQVFDLPPEPKASPQPTNLTRIGSGRAEKTYRPRGVPNSRDSSQIGITITAPSRK